MQTNLAAETRTTATGKTTARKLRASGRIPAVVYSGGTEATSITVDPHALEEIFRITGDRNTIVQIQLGGESIPCLVRTAQRNPLTRAILHVDFYRLAPGQVVEVMVPVRGEGRAKGMALGGRLRLIRREVKIRCDWSKIPSAIVQDITPMDIDDIITASQLALPAGVELVTKNDFNVMTIYGKRTDSLGLPEDAPADDEAEGEAADGEAADPNEE
jgi:large subunit ribosomal protein L25